MQNKERKNSQRGIVVAFLGKRSYVAPRLCHKMQHAQPAMTGEKVRVDMAPVNVRLRGKIHHDEWPKIVHRFKNGETLAAIARSYQCTAPAIRYIVQRSDKQSAASVAPGRLFEQDNWRGGPNGGRERELSRAPKIREVVPSSVGNDIWSRVNTDIATFLAAVDDLFVMDSDGHYEALLEATDRLLWASARTRLELERLIADRRSVAPRRRSSL